MSINEKGKAKKQSKIPSNNIAKKYRGMLKEYDSLAEDIVSKIAITQIGIDKNAIIYSSR